MTMAPRAGFEPATRSNRVLFKCRTGDSRTYFRPAPASRGPGYTTSTRPSVGLGVRSPAFLLPPGRNDPRQPSND